MLHFSKPGASTAQLHLAPGGSLADLNHAVWETVAAFRAAFDDPGFQAKLADYPTSVVVALISLDGLPRRAFVPPHC